MERAPKPTPLTEVCCLMGSSQARSCTTDSGRAAHAASFSPRFRAGPSFGCSDDARCPRAASDDGPEPHLPSFTSLSAGPVRPEVKIGTVDPDIHNSNTCEIHAAAIDLMSRSAGGRPDLAGDCCSRLFSEPTVRPDLGSAFELRSVMLKE